jgi:hypothetical protein
MRKKSKYKPKGVRLDASELDSDWHDKGICERVRVPHYALKKHERIGLANQRHGNAE